MEKKYNKQNPKKKNNARAHSNSKSVANRNRKSTTKIVKMSDDFSSQNFLYIKKVKRIFIVVVLVFLLLIVRIGFLQFVDGSFLKEKAYQQQTINQIISPKRGNIYDSTGKTLATSAQVDTITINPTKIKDKKDNKEKTTALKEKVAKGFSEIFELDYEETLEKVSSTSQVETIVKKVEKEKVDILRTWMKDNEISSGINIDEDSKRYYPYDHVLSSVIGFCGSNNEGRAGIEYKWDSALTGTPGKIVSSKGSNQQEIPNAEETYIAAENGSDLTLTIDLNIQTIVEKYLKQAIDDNNIRRGGSAIAMNPKTGDILAMASYPDYNLNTPFTPNESLASRYESLTAEQKNDSLYAMWKNVNISDLYEPGSVFKVVTAAIALEENITAPDIAGDFYCSGVEHVADRRINCWSDNPHLALSLRGALEKSCNPAMIQLGKRIGTSTLYRYFKAFGLFSPTNIALPGETNALFTQEDKVGPVELATMSFGQRFNITPLQMITAISAIANDGVLMQPRIVKQITNTDTDAVTSIDSNSVRQVISKETANKAKDMMLSVVESGTGYRGDVSGYTIGGKTGTSEPPEANKSEGYVASFVAISPIEDTQIVLLVCLYNPDKSNPNGYQGGQIAAPAASQMLTEILPYLGIPSDDANVGTSSHLITVPNIQNKTITEAEKILQSAGFTTKSSVSNKNEAIVADQVPKPGVALLKGSIVILHGEENTIRTSVTVPDLTGKTSSQAATTLKSLNLNISAEGSGSVISQDPPKNTKVDEGTIIKVTLKQSSKDSY